MKVIVTGSLGHIGLPLTKELVQKGHAVTVVSSSAEKRKDIEALGAAAAVGSVEDADFLKSAFAGADAVYAMIPPDYTAPDPVARYRKIGQNYAAAAQHSGIKHIVHLSSYGAHLSHGTGFILGSHYVEGILNELQGMAVTHLRAGYFYYNLYHFTDMIKEAGFIGSNYGGEDRIAMVAPEDIASAAAEEITTPSYSRKVRYIASDDRTANEIAGILGAAIGKPDLKWITFTDEQVKDSLMKNGMPASVAANFVELGASLHSGALREDYDLHRPDVMGKIKLEDFAREFAAAF
ncbi:NmrA family NAD(P)-binding protein [Chitinophagaceae bacterium MMS25-I14]